MKVIRTLICIATIIIVLIPLPSSAEVNLVVNFMPGIFIYSPDADGFRVSDGLETGEVSGYISNMATLSAGVGFNSPSLIFDMTGGIGYLYNSAFTAKIVTGDFALRFKIRKEELTAGPHLAFFKYHSDWDGDADVSLSNDTGIVTGLALTIGSKAFSLSGSLDYIKASFSVEGPGISLNKDELDISGLALQLGMIFRF